MAEYDNPNDSAVRTHVTGQEKPTEEWIAQRFDLYGALWAFCNRWHSGQASRGYRILSRLHRAGYSPGLGLQEGRFESEAQCDIYRALLKYRHTI